MQLNSESIVVASQNQISADLSTDGSGDFVILGMKDGMYFQLSEVGARVWQLVQEPRSIDAVVAILVDEYEVNAEQCKADVIALLGDLHQRGLVEVRDEQAP